MDVQQIFIISMPRFRLPLLALAFFGLFLENYAEKRDMLGIPKQMLYQILPIINRGADDQPGQ